MAKIHYKETAFGFEFGAASVCRCCSDEKKGWVVFEVKTPKGAIDIYVTKTGKVSITKFCKVKVDDRVEVI
jgi:hypothetical protein